MKMYDDVSRLKSNFQRAKILIIEDNEDHWLFIQKAMQKVLPEVIPAWVDTPQKALTLLEEYRYQEWEIPKLILLDLYLPERSDGLQLLRQLKAMPPPLNYIPVVMLSSSVCNTDITEAYRLGVASYLVKPIGFNDWLTYFSELRQYWWETITLPPLQYKI